MANLSRAITLCRDHEAFTAGLVAERDAARVGLERFRAALDTSGDVIAIIDASTGRLVDFNATAEAALGYARAAPTAPPPPRPPHAPAPPPTSPPMRTAP